MKEFYVLKVIYHIQAGTLARFTTHKYAGPFGTAEEAKTIADTENAARSEDRNKGWFIRVEFYVGTKDEIGRTGIIPTRRP